MSYRQKALEIYNKFRNEAPVLEANVKSKKNAIIAVDLVIETLKSEGIEYGAKNWECVKIELQQL